MSVLPGDGVQSTNTCYTGDKVIGGGIITSPQRFLTQMIWSGPTTSGGNEAWTVMLKNNEPTSITTVASAICAHITP